jgi:AcrR family transcriptional regulator
MKDLSEKQNRKIRYTKMVLHNSLMELMKTKNVLRITIKDLCDTADICRTTFYAHYKDQYDLLEQVQEETLAYFEDTLKEFDTATNSPNSNQKNQKIAEEVLQHIANNSNSIQVLLSENGSIDFQKKIFGRITKRFQQLRKNHIGKAGDEKKEAYYSVFVVHGAIALIQYWLKTNMDMTVPEIAKMLIKLTQTTRQ